MTDTGANGSSWTLQYALDSANRSSYSHGVLVPPFAISKSLPRISFQAATRDRGAIIVVFGVINPQGRFEDLRIMQSPDSDLNPLLLDALGRWTFRPAEIDGARVRVKVLLGVPVNSVPLRE
jgi:outer membrane biosynthesis protein TonB